MASYLYMLLLLEFIWRKKTFIPLRIRGFVMKTRQFDIVQPIFVNKSCYLSHSSWVKDSRSKTPFQTPWFSLQSPAVINLFSCKTYVHLRKNQLLLWQIFYLWHACSGLKIFLFASYEFAWYCKKNEFILKIIQIVFFRYWFFLKRSRQNCPKDPTYIYIYVLMYKKP